MVSTLPAYGDPALAGSSEDAPADILDTSDAGTAVPSLDRLHAMLASNAIALTVVLAAGVPLIRIYGAKGASIALVVAELTLSLCYEWSLSHTRPELRFDRGYVLRAAAATLTAGAVAPLLGVSPVASAVLASVIYIAALSVFGLTPDESRAALFRRRRPAV